MASFVRRLTLSSQGKPHACSVDADSVLLKGHLKKKGHIRRNWLERYFLLCPSGLYYYKDEMSAALDGAKPLGMVVMFGCTVKEDMFQRHENVFSIFTAEGKDYHLQAKDAEEMNRWISAIENARELANESRRQTESDVKRTQSDAGDMRRKARLKATVSLPSSVGASATDKQA